jgi:predicted outer membrane lipoprotein
MDKRETKANEEWTSQRQSQMMNGQASSFAFVSGLSILHFPLSLVCPFFICLCLWLVHSSFAFVSGLSILHLALSLACPFFICLCLWLVHSSKMKKGQTRDKGKGRMDKSETKANEEWTSQRQRQMKNGQARDKGK